MVYVVVCHTPLAFAKQLQNPDQVPGFIEDPKKVPGLINAKPRRFKDISL